MGKDRERITIAPVLGYCPNKAHPYGTAGLACKSFKEERKTESEIKLNKING